MQNIVICGDVGDRKLTESIIKACEMNGGVMVCDRGKVYETCEEPRFFIVTDICEMSCRGIVVLGENVGKLKLSEDMTVIIEGENVRGLEILKGQGCKNVVTCSMNRRATLSMSGIYPEKVASLQRGLKTLDGGLIEPCEFVIKSCGDEIYPIMAAGAVMILSDGEVREKYCC